MKYEKELKDSTVVIQHELEDLWSINIIDNMSGDEDGMYITAEEFMALLDISNKILNKARQEILNSK